MFIDIKLFAVLLSLSLAPMLVTGQQPGTLTPEVHPKLTWQKCAKGGHCSTVHGEIVSDSEWRWLHNGQNQNCFLGNGQWDHTSCPDDATCAKNCHMEGIQYLANLGVSTSGNSIRQNFLTNHAVGSRVYLLSNDSHYEMFNLLGQEFTFDVDISKLECGMNGALYLVAMEADGGMHRYPGNKAGAKYGTGYCDAQCPNGLKFTAETPQRAGAKVGVCCAEMDIWEGNKEATVYTAHPCSTNGFHVCKGDACGGNGHKDACDKGGCDFNSYRMGEHGFYGPGKKVDTNKVFTVVTQFITSDGTAHGHLTEIRRFYVQNGHVIPNSVSKIAGVTGNSISQPYCEAYHKGYDTFTPQGGLTKMGDNMHGGMVLALALWDDAGGHMQWLDGEPGGPCPKSAGNPADLEKNFPNAYVTWSNIKVGPINSTFHH